MMNLSTSILSSRPDNLSSVERWASLLLGLGLAAGAVARGGGLIRRGALSAAGLMLISRGTAGYCGVKAAMGGEASFGEGMREQWQRTRASLGAGAGAIEDLLTLYTEELQELYSAEDQLLGLLRALPRHVEDADLQRRINSYASEVRTREEDLDRILGLHGQAPGEHRDTGMTSLIGESRKMAQIPSPALRAAAMVASLQRLMHHLIAAYSSCAIYARILGHTEEAARLTQYAERDKALDAELAQFARTLLSQRDPAAVSGRGGAGELRTH